ncbi:MAG: LysE family translocator [Desulfobacterales bacterium]|jgi:threonine/homoserine/homoserine lactone efflux protein|nr:LysE family translocator [Deltaproteobacteria bacterium]
MLEFLSAGILLGLAAGFAPGPLLVLVISETLRHGIKAGLKVSIAPLITDVPIILVSLLILDKLAQFKSILGCISIIGGLFILYLGYESLKTKGVELNLSSVKTSSFKKGVITNALNPHPYVFYMTVGAPIIYRSISQHFLFTVSFVGSFLLLLVGSKVILAMVVERSRTFLKGRLYIWVMRILGVLLIIFSIVLFRDGLELFGWLQPK